MNEEKQNGNIEAVCPGKKDKLDLVQVQAVMPARASDDPISLRKPRRETASIHSEAPLGNSRCIIKLMRSEEHTSELQSR